MGSFGGRATFPIELGGDDTALEKTYVAFRGMLGVGGVSVDDGGIDGLLLTAWAIGIAAIYAFDERAALQFFPDVSIDLIPVFEDILRIVPDAGATEEDRRIAVAVAWTKQLSAEIPTLSTILKSIDPRFSVLDPAWATAQVTIRGRAFEPYAPGPATGQAFRLGADGSKGWSDYPMFSTRDVVSVLLDLGSGTVPGLAEKRLISEALKILDEVLPSFVRPQVVTSVGLIAGVTPIGYTGASST